MTNSTETSPKQNPFTIKSILQELKDLSSPTFLVHKLVVLQGSSYKKVVFDLTEVPTRKHHLVYVGISRVTNLDGLYLVGFNEKYIQTNPKMKREMARLRF